MWNRRRAWEVQWAWDGIDWSSGGAGIRGQKREMLGVLIKALEIVKRKEKTVSWEFYFCTRMSLHSRGHDEMSSVRVCAAPRNTTRLSEGVRINRVQMALLSSFILFSKRKKYIRDQLCFGEKNAVNHVDHESLKKVHPVRYGSYCSQWVAELCATEWKQCSNWIRSCWWATFCCWKRTILLPWHKQLLPSSIRKCVRLYASMD